MTWNDFIYFAIPAILMWVIAGILVYAKKTARASEVLMLM